MLKEIRFQNFRCFKDLKIEGLQRFNIFGGKNNVGKTSLLEGLSLVLNPTDPSHIINLNYFRNYQFEISQARNLWDNMFNQKDEQIVFHIIDIDSLKLLISTEEPKTKSKPIKLTEEFLSKTGADQAVLKYVYELNNEVVDSCVAEIKDGAILTQGASTKNFRRFPSHFFPSTLKKRPKRESDKFGNIIQQRKKGKLLEAIKILDNKIKDLLIISIEGIPIIHVDIGLPYYLPIYFLGEGAVKYLSILVDIANLQDGVLLIDEIENGIHYSVYDEFLSNVISFSDEYNVQIFATTHSRELVEAAHRVFCKKEGYPFRYYRLSEINGDIVSTGYDKDTLEAALEMDMEVR